MGSSFGRSFDPSRLKSPEPFHTPGIGDGIQESKRGFSEAFSDIRAGNQDAGIAGPEKRGGLFGSGINGEEFVTMLTRAAALAQGDYSGAAQIGQLLGRDKRDAAQRAAEREDYRWKKQTDQEFAQPDLPPIVRDAHAWAAMTPEERAAYTAYQEVANPIVQRGADGLPRAFPRGPQLPSGLDPNEWEIVPDPQQGGPTPQASGNFPGLPPRRRYR